MSSSGLVDESEFHSCRIWFVLQSMTYLNSLKLCVLSFIFENVPKTCRKCSHTSTVYAAGAAASSSWNWKILSSASGLVVVFAVTVIFVNQKGQSTSSLAATRSGGKESRFVQHLPTYIASGDLADLAGQITHKFAKFKDNLEELLVVFEF